MPINTSKAAAKSIHGFSPVQEKQVIAAVKATEDGLTREEISSLAEIGLASVRARVNELLRRGVLLLRPELRKTKSGRWAEIVVVSPESPEVSANSLQVSGKMNLEKS